MFDRNLNFIFLLYLWEPHKKKLLFNLISSLTFVSVVKKNFFLKKIIFEI